MKKFSKLLAKTFAIFSLCIVVIIALFVTGIVESPVFLDIYSDKQYEKVTDSSNTGTEGNTNSNSNSNQGNSNSNSVTISTNTSVDERTVPSALTIKLSGNYLTAFNKAVKTLPADDLKSQVLLKVGLQILQSKTITYHLALHFYSLDYKNTSDKKNKQTYNLNDAIRRINSGQYIYTDCFGFVRLTHSIACYTLNNKNPESVSGLSGLYGYKGAYSQGAEFNSLSKLKSGAVIYDTLTGSGSGERHVAMYLYSNGSEVVYMDQSGIHTGTFKSGSHIYSPLYSNPYKFNKFKNYN